ncbi:class I SAM-dependent methyltransferase [Actinomarinicola tropica]|uniref:Methyltransferase domain-containing protein n=1 Tax=Actinomarinicola tropica TaxID=2789776 RepID=A0A5Q2RJA6_9ACTN|nr:class I SAM-dependent methyltransferase [Actinomarinicola tropica]QGG94972.1 methyltransferase domain-containing protein [Actinomarinicola tropica]
MPVMSRVEAAFCRSAPWRAFTGRVVVPWVLRGEELAGEVLEIGSGAGANASVIAETQPQTRVTATDLDPAMVTAARARLARYGERATVAEADSTRLPFDADHFDAAVSLLMLHHVIDWEAAIREMARVVRPGGRVVGYDLIATPGARLLHLADRSPHRLLSRGELRDQLIASGFDDVDVTPTLGGLAARFHATVGDAL